ncbi:MAG TPA: hypothetical protein VFT62_00815 [Mycobacteriales bacterium]|nr:hypothetical protein [Mycobacteriales bacterium]
MAAQLTSTTERSLLATVEEAHERALGALDSGEVLDAVVWLSAHLAAVHRVIQPALRRIPGESAARQRQRMLDLQLERLLRIAERRFSGDAQAAELSSDNLERGLRTALTDHAHAEHSLVAHLESVLSAEELAVLSSAYAAALQHAPTRPHPHAPHFGLLGMAAFRIDAWRDKLLDTMDSRHVPAPRVERHPSAPGRWARYLLGQMER